MGRGVVHGQEFVGVEDEHPVGGADKRFGLRVVEGGGLGFLPLGDHVAAVVSEASSSSRISMSSVPSEQSLV